MTVKAPIDVLENNRPGSRNFSLKSLLWILSAAWGTAAYGYGNSVISTTFGQPSFISYMGLDTRSNANSLIGVTGSIFYVGGFFGGFFGGWAADKWGRKRAIFGASLMLLIFTALETGSVNIEMFIVARFFVGFFGLVEYSMVPLYIAEIAPPRQRGALSESNIVMVNFAFTTASYVGVGFYHYQPKGHQNTWRAPLALGIVFCLLCMISIPFAPESPRYLLLKGQEEKAWKITRDLHTTPDDPEHLYANSEFQLMKAQLRHEKQYKASYLEIFRQPSYRKRTYYATATAFLYTSSGSLVINTYGTFLYAGLGYRADQTLLFQAGWVTTAMVTSAVAITFIDRIRRPTLLAIGLMGSSVTLAIECAIQAKYLHTDNKSALAAGVAMLFVAVAFIAMFLDAPLTFYAAEIYPSHLRARGMPITSAAFCLSSIMWLQAAPTAFAKIGWKFYLLFIVTGSIGSVVTYFTFPETRNLPLEQISKIFGDETYEHEAFEETGVSSTHGVGEKQENSMSSAEIENSDRGV